MIASDRAAPPQSDLLNPDRLRAALSRGLPWPPLPVADGPDRPAAVLVALTTGPDPAVLLTRRAASLRRHAGQVAFPGGRIDPGDTTPEAAALREAHEEVGLDPAAVRLLGRLPPLVTGTSFHVTPVVGLIPPDVVLTPMAAEVAGIFLLPLHVVRDPAAPTRRRAEFDGSWRDFWVWPHPDHYIWGATAAILVELAAVLNRRDGPDTQTSPAGNVEIRSRQC